MHTKGGKRLAVWRKVLISSKRKRRWRRSSRASLNQIPTQNRGSGITVRPLHVTLAASTHRALLILFVAVFFVLLISCSNVANLLLARSATRERELAVRTALGAGRGRLARQVLTESAFIALISGIAGVTLASVALHYLVTLAPADIPRIDEARLDAGVLAFAAVISVLAALIFGSAPAFRCSDGNPAESLKSGIGPVAHSGARTRSALVITEFALAFVLLAGTGLLVRSFLAARDVDPGFEPQRALTMSISLPAASSNSRNLFYDAELERVKSLPGVESAGEVDALFELDGISNLGLRAIEGRTPEPRERWTPLSWVAVRGDYFQAMGTPLLRGRYFGPEGGPNSSLIAILDESMAKRYWPNEDPIGKRFKGQDPRGQNDDWLTVIGVVRDTHRNGLERSPIPHVFEPSTQAIDGDRTPYLIVRTRSDPQTLAGELRSAVRSLSSSAIVSGVTTLQQELDEKLSARRFQTSMLGLFCVTDSWPGWFRHSGTHALLGIAADKRNRYSCGTRSSPDGCFARCALRSHTTRTLGRSYRGLCGGNPHAVYGQPVVRSTADRSTHLYLRPTTPVYHCSGCKFHSGASGNEGRSHGCTEIRMRTGERTHKAGVRALDSRCMMRYPSFGI
jgi:putative ABC transport system permease protein